MQGHCKIFTHASFNWAPTTSAGEGGAAGGLQAVRRRCGEAGDAGDGGGGGRGPERGQRRRASGGGPGPRGPGPGGVPGPPCRLGSAGPHSA